MDFSCYTSGFSKSQAYQDFRASVPLRQVTVDDNGSSSGKVWKIFDCGPRTIACPIVFLPPVSGTADCFFLQCLALSQRGYRVICAECPCYWKVEDWCQGFRNLLSQLHVEKVHLFGAALGGFLAQKFAEFTRQCPRVASMILCNTFTNTSVFNFSDQSQVFWVLPSPILKGMIMGGIKVDTTAQDSSIDAAADFMEERLDCLSQTNLASRLSMNCAPNQVEPETVNDLPVTIITVWDASALSESVKEDLCKAYPNAKMAHMKTGGNFPFLSRSDEVNMHILIHLRNFDNGVP